MPGVGGWWRGCGVGDGAEVLLRIADEESACCARTNERTCSLRGARCRSFAVWLALGASGAVAFALLFAMAVHRWQ